MASVYFPSVISILYDKGELVNYLFVCVLNVNVCGNLEILCRVVDLFEIAFEDDYHLFSIFS